MPMAFQAKAKPLEVQGPWTGRSLVPPIGLVGDAVFRIHLQSELGSHLTFLGTPSWRLWGEQYVECSEHSARLGRHVEAN